MKKLLTFLFAILAFSGMSQTENNPQSLGLHFGTMEYRGDLGSEYFGFSNMHGAFALSYNQYLSKSWDICASISHGLIDYSTRRAQRNWSMSANITNLSLSVKYKFANGKLLKEDFFIQPYLQLGFGDAYVASDWTAVPLSDTSGETQQYAQEKNNMYFNFPVGIGITYPINDNFAINLATVHHYSTSDFVDGVNNGDYGDSWIMHSLGVHYTLK